MIKLYDDGLMSSAIRGWRVGRSVEMRGPFGEFEHSQDKQEKLLLISQVVKLFHGS